MFVGVKVFFVFFWVFRSEVIWVLIICSFFCVFVIERVLLGWVVFIVIMGVIGVVWVVVLEKVVGVIKVLIISGVVKNLIFICGFFLLGIIVCNCK